MNEFINALKQGDLEKIKSCPKADLHNHFVLGGSRHYLKQLTGVEITPVKTPLASMDEMHAWNRDNIGDKFNGTEMRKVLIRAAFQQAKEDGGAERSCPQYATAAANRFIKTLSH